MCEDQYFWDAGNIGCGELLMYLKKKLSSLPPGSEFRLISKDPGAIEDLPAWAKLTGNKILSAQHPEYILKTKE